MCHKRRGPCCSTCHKPAPYHRCRCPAKYAPSTGPNIQHDGLPTYAAAIESQPPTSTPLPLSTQSHCGSRNYGGCGRRRRPFRGPIHLLISLVVRKVQEKKERERLAANGHDEKEGEMQERGTVEAMNEQGMKEEEVKGVEKYEGVNVLTESIRSMSL